ncbi:MAG: OadG family protein, partial [Ruminococcus flavefaciens]|nr:OadG family protein [Ruminococcus flavefaciens]
MSTPALMAHMDIGDAGIAAVLGYVVVFFGLVLLMCVVIIMGKAMAGTNKKAAPAPAAAAPAPQAGVHNFLADFLVGHLEQGLLKGHIAVLVQVLVDVLSVGGAAVLQHD